MKGLFVKITGVLAGTMAALFGISSANVEASVPDVTSKGKALYLEHGKSISGNPNSMLAAAFEHISSHMSHVSRVKTQSQTDKVQKVQPVKNKSKVIEKTGTKELDKKPSVR